jgi:GDP-mannose 6-dehydrogenase
MKNEIAKQQNESPLHVAVVGLGYVGCVTAACLAKLGHTVIGIDREEHKVQNINSQHAPFYEPGLVELLEEPSTFTRLTATTSLAKGLENADVALLCVGTPSQPNGDISLDHLRRVCFEIAALLPARSKPLIVAVRSTVFPGSCESLLEDMLGRHPLVRIVCNPEFLREGSAVQDFLAPSLLVVGGNDLDAVTVVSNLYATLPVRASLVGLRTAEIIKYACNAFHAVKIGFANEIGTLATQFGVDAEEVMHTLCQDGKLNISAAYLKPGFAFGGSCLPKDLRAIVYRGRRSDLSLPLLESVLPSNERHLQRAINLAQSLPGDRISVFGLAFKENTDDLRESPVVTLLEQLLAKGKLVRVYDPHIQLDTIYGSNLNFLLSALPHIGRLLVSDLPELISWSDQLIVAQKLSPSAEQLIRSAAVEVLDLTRIYAYDQSSIPVST